MADRCSKMTMQYPAICAHISSPIGATQGERAHHMLGYKVLLRYNRQRSIPEFIQSPKENLPTLLLQQL